jgi:hypothetical protein
MFSSGYPNPRIFRLPARLAPDIWYLLKIKDLRDHDELVVQKIYTPTPGVVNDVCANKGLTAIWCVSVC